MPNKFSPELETGIAAAKAGAEVVLRYFANLSSAEVSNKNSSSDDGNSEYRGIVTQADIESEKVIVERIRHSFPSHAFLGEESNRDPADSENLWVIDPIDGTNNFANGIPHFAISIAYYESGNPVCGVILNPCRQDLFCAQVGEQAVWNGEPVQVNQHQSLSETMIAVGFYYDRGPMMRATLAAIEELFQQQIHGIRRFGTASLDLVQVGLGRFGGFFEYELSPWDFAAARIFVEQAGGKITTCTGDHLPLKSTSVLASNGRLHSSILEIVSKHAQIRS